MFSAKFTSDALSKVLSAVVKTQITESCLSIGKAIESLVLASVEKGIPVIKFTVDVPNRTIIPDDATEKHPKVGVMPIYVQKAVLTRVRDELVRHLGPNALGLYVPAETGGGKYHRYPMPEPADAPQNVPVQFGFISAPCTRCGRFNHVAAGCYAKTTTTGLPITGNTPMTSAVDVSEGIMLDLRTFITDI